MIAFKTFICSKTGISDEMWNLLEEGIETRCFKKGERIIFKDDIWTEVMYINSGLIRSYIINDNGKDFTRQFYFNTSESRTANLFVHTFYHALLTQTPKERYLELQKSMSGLMTQVRQYHVASYLGITPVTLSRIKRELKTHTKE